MYNFVIIVTGLLGGNKLFYRRDAKFTGRQQHRSQTHSAGYLLGRARAFGMKIGNEINCLNMVEREQFFFFLVSSKDSSCLGYIQNELLTE